MANLIDYTYFKGDINLPAQLLTGLTPRIDFYIAKYEKEALMSLFGYDLYKDLKSQIDSLPQIFSTKWNAFVRGDEYVMGSYTKKWDGLINDDKSSLLAYYVYYNYLRDNVTSYETIGAVTGLGENSSRVAADGLIIAAYNRYIDLRQEAIEYITANLDDFPLLVFESQPKANIFGI